MNWPKHLENTSSPSHSSSNPTVLVDPAQTGGQSTQTAEFDDDFVLTAAIMILLLQTAFAFKEAGSVRYKNTQSIVIKMIINACIGIVFWWTLGYAFGFGSKPFVGLDKYFFLIGIGDDLNKFVFQTTVAIFATTIVSGAAAERMIIPAWAIASFFFSGFIYPACLHWNQANAWLSALKYHDLAGAGFIHIVAGTCGLLLTVFLKPRFQRFPSTNNRFLPYNTTFVALGTLIIYPCWLFLTTGFTLKGSYEAKIQGLIAANTLLAGATGSVVAFFLHYLIHCKYSLFALCNGLVAGLVVVSGDCDNIANWAALIFGFFGAAAYIIFVRVLNKIEIDDPVQVIPVHLIPGIVGTFLTGLFDQTGGLFYGKGGSLLGGQIVGIFVYVGFPVLIFTPILFLLKGLGFFKVDSNVEKEGLDLQQCGQEGYDFGELLPPPQPIVKPIPVATTGPITLVQVSPRQ